MNITYETILKEWEENGVGSSWLSDYLYNFLYRIENDTGINITGMNLLNPRDATPLDNQRGKLYKYGKISFVRYDTNYNSIALGYETIPFTKEDAGKLEKILGMPKELFPISFYITGVDTYYIPIKFFTDYDKAVNEVKTKRGA